MLWRRKAKIFRTKPVKPHLIPELNYSQSRIDGFNLAAWQRNHFVMVGAGGLGSHISSALIRKGVGILSTMDDDLVELKNLSRQLFLKSDIGKYKAIQLGKHLSKQGLFPTEIRTYPFRFQELLEDGHDFSDAAVLICGVDNTPTRRHVTLHALEYELPVIHTAVSLDGYILNCFIQQPGQACWGCRQPEHIGNDITYPCDQGGIIDVLQIAAGLVVFAIDTIIGERNRQWNFREIYLDGTIPDKVRTIDRNPDCPLCGNLSATSKTSNDASLLGEHAEPRHA